MRRGYASWALAAAALSLVAIDSAVVANRLETPAFPMSVAVAKRLVTESPAAAAKRAHDRDVAVKALFDRRANAIRNRDRRAFLGDIDPRERAFVAEQAQVFDSLGKLDFSAWSYEPNTESYDVTSIDYGKYAGDDDVWLPVLILRYTLRGFDTGLVGRRVVYTVVRRGSRWYIASDTDLDASTSSGTSVRVDPWENGPILVEHSAHGVVIGHPEDSGSVDAILAEVESAVRHVTKYVGTRWNQRVVVVLPTDQDELNRVLENPQTFYDFAAIARPLATLPSDGGAQKIVGARVVINPDGFVAGSEFTRTLLRHEITHVALFGRTGPLSPKWLIEGVAEYVGNAESTLPTRELAGSLAARVRRDGVPAVLPTDSDFGLIDNAGIGYNSAWLLCRYIASRYGRAALFRLYDVMGSPGGLDHPGDKLPNAFRSVLHTDETALLRGWRPYVNAAVGDLAKVLVSPGTGYREDDRGEVGISDIAKERRVPEQQLGAIGVERGAEGFWLNGTDAAPRRIVVATAIVARDHASAAVVERTLAARYTPFDSGRPVPGGRLYVVTVTIGSRQFREAVVLARAGIVTVEVRVAAGSGDPRPEATRLAAAQLAAVS